MLVVVASMSFSLGAGDGVGVAVTDGEVVGVGDVHPDSTSTAAIAIIAKIERLMTLLDCIVIPCYVYGYTKYRYRNYYMLTF
jgi:hypothetical protein